MGPAHAHGPGVSAEHQLEDAAADRLEPHAPRRAGHGMRRGAEVEVPVVYWSWCAVVQDCGMCAVVVVVVVEVGALDCFSFCQA